MTRMRLMWLICIVIVLLAGCQPGGEGLTTSAASGIIMQVGNLEDYLVTHIGISGFGGVVFCAYEPLHAEQGADGTLYLWILCQEYYPEHESLVPGSGVSLPVALQLDEKNGNYQVVDHIVPRDGTYYGADVRAAFPSSTWSQIMPQAGDEIDQHNDRVNRLEIDTEAQARLYFGMGDP